MSRFCRPRRSTPPPLTLETPAHDAALGCSPRAVFAHALVERLSGEILSGRLAPGAQLPTEQELIAASGVSRTVVREAIAALRAEGLVVTRQGAGAFCSPRARAGRSASRPPISPRLPRCLP